MSLHEHTCTFKVLVLGESGVGKTSIINRFTEDVFKSSYINTIGIDSHRTNIELDGEVVQLQIWDTAGQERFRTLTNTYYRGAKGIILVYDVTSVVSLTNIKFWIENIKEKAKNDVTCILIANKIDMPEEKIVVTKENAARFAEHHDLPLYEVSAKNGTNVNEAFNELAQAINVKRLTKKEEPNLVTIETQEKPRSGCC